MSLLATLSPDAIDDLRALIDELVREAFRGRERERALHEWLTTADAAELLSTTENAVRCRLRRGWLAGDVTRDGKRLLVRRAALLEYLDRRVRK